METVLVVDDEVRNRALVRAILGRIYHVVEAASAVEAYEQLDRHDVDIVLLDVLMPGESGVAAASQIKRATANRGFLPIIMLTALSDQDDRNAALAAGADDFLSKPVDQRELVLRVQALLRVRAQEATIRRQRDEIQKVMDLKDDLFGLLVHDLRNPLTSVIAMLQMLKDDASTSQAIDDATAGLVAAQRVGGVIDDILQLIALEAGHIQMLWSECNLSRVASDAASSLRGAARESDVEMNVMGEGVVEGDRALLRRAIENLLANAVRYAPRHSCIDVNIAARENRVVIAVNDRGPGVPEERKRELFTKFGGVAAGVDATARRSYGFGLYLVDLVARAHRGTARVFDRDGGGASFELSIPSLRQV
jgi:two-component system sensor histidine kinase/response regulator